MDINHGNPTSSLRSCVPLERADLHDQEPIGGLLFNDTPICRCHQEGKGHIMKTDQLGRAESVAGEASDIVMRGGAGNEYAQLPERPPGQESS